MTRPGESPFPLVLIILDGWGEGPDRNGNAVRGCRPAAIQALAAEWPCARIEASGEVVGLPAGKMGNSEAGHLCLGAGRSVFQDLSRISRAIRSGEFSRNPTLREAMEGSRRGRGSLHLMGLVSDGGVHSHIDHLEALLRLASDCSLRDVRVHAFTDGRDTPPDSGAGHLRRLERFLEGSGAGRIVTVAGRYFAMDRDRRWDRTEKAFEAMIRGVPGGAGGASDYAESRYARGETDEFLPPAAIGGPAEVERTRIRDGDTVIFFNFRADRARQITRAFTEPGFDGFRAAPRPRLERFVGFTVYDPTFPLPAAGPPEHPRETVAEIVARRGWRQTRIAETEKYAHVTFFFNGGIEASNPGEERILVPSAKVATYDLKPEMSAPEITAEVLRRLRGGSEEILIVNFANADMVGHTGVYDAAVRACGFLDGCVGRIVGEVLGRGGLACVTADHGNAEQMTDPVTGQPHTAHTTNPVPLILAGEAVRGRRLRDRGGLPDVIPTLLEVLAIDPPAAMTGRSLLG
ncbi:MAG: 2,3-bisphosphoglycerate-independent phosphoglycerate mutase [Acidobacteria bacterium]|nr:2,3-bisphosphoglycerate-independent phosphoglycerate mutase [Acidobacteriota bacterium]